MSYLQLDNGIPDFSQAVMSFWFRVPKASLTAAAAAYTGDPGAVLDGIIPLVVMGEKGTGQIPTSDFLEHTLYSVSTGYTAAGLSFTETTTVLGPCPAHGTGSSECQVTNSYSPAGTFVPTGPDYQYQDIRTFEASGEAPPTDPTFIGVLCGGPISEPRLLVNFETNKKPTASSCNYEKSSTMGSATSSPGDPSQAFRQGDVVVTGCSIPFGLPVPFYDIVTTDGTHMVNPPDSTVAVAHSTYSDISELFVCKTGAIYSDKVPITPDDWHHVLICVDLRTIQTHGRASPGELSKTQGEFVDSAARIFVALDDVNYTGSDLSGNWPNGFDLNGVITEDALSVAGSNPVLDDDGNPVGTPQYLLDSPSVPCGGHPLGLPGSNLFMDNIYPVEMAEFQMWTGVTLDTGIETNRRAFISRGGTPADPLKKPNPPPPSPLPPGWVPPPKGPQELLGKEAEILLHGSGNWINGKNTGKVIKLNEIGKPSSVAAEQFKPTGSIVSYSPDPSLHGAQSPPPPRPPLR
jgi:hypothetical protein